MNTFLKVLLLLVAAVVAVKLLPVALAIGCLLAAPVTVLAILGMSIAGAAMVAALVVAAILSPIWLPVLAVVGLVALCRRGGSKPVAAP